MRILIDLQGAQNGSRHRGIGRYSIAIAKAIARNRGRHELFILLNSCFPDTIDDIKKAFFGLLPNHHFIVFNVVEPIDEFRKENSWRVRSAELIRESLINDLKPDILLISSLFEGACDNTVTSVGRIFSQVPTAVILYDLIPYISPEKYIGWDRASNWYYRKIDALLKADLLLAISNSAQREAIEHLKVEPQRTVSISSAADVTFTKTNLISVELSELLARYKIKRKYIMLSSALEERKNFEGLIKAFGTLPPTLREEFQLVLVCKLNNETRSALNKIADKAGLRDSDLILTDFVSDKDLIALYSECYLFVFPSFHEGFGLPALEAMCCGAPVIGSNVSSIPEVVGRDDALFDPQSTKSIADLIERVLTDVSFWQSLKEHAITQAKKFNWDSTAKLTIEALEKLHAEKSIQESVDIGQNDISVLLEAIAAIKSESEPTESDFIKTAEAIDKNLDSACNLKAHADYSGSLKWRIEGPFDSSYSLALLNRESARALDELGHFVVLHSTEGPGDYIANPKFLALNPDIATMHERSRDYSPSVVDVVSRNLYPPRVEDMTSKLNMLHHYAWEESAFPQNWVNNFNSSLNGITCLSSHVKKILIDSGVHLPMITSGCGVDHWERIIPKKGYQVKAKQFRFLHVSSCFPRKGADLLLDAYGLAFTAKNDVSLIIKTFANPHNEIHSWLAERKAHNPQFPEVLIIEGDLSDAELKSLYQQCHVLVAPSMAEGFGLPMAEAMLSGLPVITTAWGGQLDFCDDENSWLIDYEFERAKTHFGIFASVWAKANLNELTKALIQAHKSPPSLLHNKAHAGRRKLLENFKWVDVMGRVVNAAKNRQFIKDKPQDLRIGWITPWNSKCGIASYSKHLIANVCAPVTVLAPHQDVDLRQDDDNCVRCWDIGKEANNLQHASTVIQTKQINTLIIQFNYSFFNNKELIEFLEFQLSNGLVVLFVPHSTNDPCNEVNNKLIELQPTLARCHRVLVHSIPDLNRLKSLGLIDNVALFPHGFLNVPEITSIENFENTPLVVSYGFCLPHKGLAQLIEAIEILKTQGQFVRLKMVNCEYPDPISTNLINELKLLIKKLKVDDRIEMCTEFLADKESLVHLREASLIVFPYQQTGESSSAAVRMGLSANRPIAVTPLSIFDDIGETAFRFTGISSIDIAKGIVDFLHDLSVNSEKAQNIKANSVNWRNQHDFVTVSKRLINICYALRQVRKDN